MKGMVHDLEVHPDDEVTIVFRKIISEGPITLKKLETGPESPSDGEIVQYYDIQTEMIFEGHVKIRIINEQVRQGELLQWTGTEWVDRTLYCMRVGKYTLIVGVTDHLSIFGIR